METEDKVDRRWKRVAIQLRRIYERFGSIRERLALLEASFAARPAPEKGEAGPGPTLEQIAAAVADYLAENPPAPGVDGKPPSEEEVHDLISQYVAAYLEANPPKDGRDADPPSDAQILDAVQKYLRANPPEKGDKGDKGDAGKSGKKGGKGDAGQLGPMPKHEWRGSELRFEIEPGKWGKWADLQGPPPKPLPRSRRRREWADERVWLGITEQRVIELIEANMALDSGEQDWLTAKATVTASGDTTVLTPASGKRIVIRKVYALNAPDAADPALIKIKLLDDNGADEWIRNYGILTRQKRTGAIDAPVVVNLDVAGSVAVTVFYEETT